MKLPDSLQDAIVRQWRLADGVAHLILGPIIIIAVAPVSDLLGLPTGPLLVFLLLFTLYGAVVVLGTRRDQVSDQMLLLGVAANAVFVVVVAGTALMARPTSVGLAVLLAVMSSGVVVAGALGFALYLRRKTTAPSRPI